MATNITGVVSMATAVGNTSLADISTEMEHLKNNIDDVFITTSGITVCLMQCGFACLEAGAVRSKNTTNIMMKNIMDIFISSVAYWLFGFALAYGDGNSVIGYTHWAGMGVDYGKMADWFFQCIFAATAATIVSGAVAERCNYIAYITYSFVISGFVYPPVTHWAWTEHGWLKKLGYVDYSGCGPIHLIGGVCSFYGAFFLGPRIGRFAKKFNNSEKEELVGHSVPLTGIGGLILITGFLAFNAGSIGSMSKPGDHIVIARVITNTVLGGSGGSLVMLAMCKLGLGVKSAWSFSHTLNAALAGMVSVCAGADVMRMWASFLSGALTAPIYLGIHHIMIWIEVDDPLDAVAVHFGGGFWGLISASLFGLGGIVYGAGNEAGSMLWHRIVGASVIILWGSVWSCVMFGLLKWCGKLRVTEEQELEGLDIAMHNEPGYPLKGWNVPPQFSLHPETQYSVRPHYEPLPRTEAELDVEPITENGTQNSVKSATDTKERNNEAEV
ncbi:putative ammonium transporter 1 [Zootermopsis nevadensis]|uniref:putative ammonium transporter 1 n=1 Tax=Zootermopsis nevadensis TaxID=136037 RepID=UPI000B8ECF61|nr:putative ammonium transporter 1 [Zootermopsis nevadensis]XP_021933568.1 putative ammonium transporter 1 [Zootermopsis nevadensis]